MKTTKLQECEVSVVMVFSFDACVIYDRTSCIHQKLFTMIK